MEKDKLTEKQEEIAKDHLIQEAQQLWLNDSPYEEISVFLKENPFRIPSEGMKYINKAIENCQLIEKKKFTISGDDLGLPVKELTKRIEELEADNKRLVEVMKLPCPDCIHNFRASGR